MPVKSSSLPCRGSQTTVKAGRKKNSMEGQMLFEEFSSLELELQRGSERPPCEELYVPATATQSLSTTNRVSEIIHSLLFPDRDENIGINQSATAKANIDLSKIRLGRNFGEFERAVLEGVFAQMLAGNASCMTPAMIYRAMTGKQARCSVSAEMTEIIDRTVTHCMYSPCVVSIEGENGTECLDTNILHMRRRYRNVSGHVTVTYEVVAMPVILELCMKTDALTLTPMVFLSAPITMSKRGVAILNALQRHTAPYIWSANGSLMLAREESGITPDPIVLPYDELYQIAWESDRVGADAGGEGHFTWSLMDRVRKNVTTILSYWQDNGYIESWENNIKVRKVESVSIRFLPISPTFYPLRHLTPLQLRDDSILKQ